METMIQAEKLTKRYEGELVLDNLSLEIYKGEFVAIMGRSGCGKSTLLYCASGMDRTYEGRLTFGGRNLQELTAPEMEQLRLRQMGFIFQKPHFLRSLSIQDNIIFPAFQAGLRPRKEILEEAYDLMEQMGIAEIAEKDSLKVSGGQLQRAAICRALINHPAMLFGDEPTGALNSSAAEDVMDILQRIHQKGTTILMVTHDEKVAARADRIIHLRDGMISHDTGIA